MTRLLRTILTTLLLSVAINLSLATPTTETYHFTLTGPENKPVSDTDFSDKYLLIAFGFTSCPDVCPTTLYEFAQMLKIIKTPEKLQPIFITIDPLRDDPNRLNQYTNFFDKRIIGLTGDMSMIENTAKRFNATFGYRYQGKKVTPPDLPVGYTVYHSTMIYLLSPTRELIDAFDYQSGAEKLAHDIEKAITENENREKRP
ncbi:MAG: SCO family protein [Cardiobacteriaceae bacterium]|nr:SCO family protein [Cardiobacteriaceae bacterium]